MRYICENLETNGAPVIVFAKGVSSYKNLADLKCDVLGVDWVQEISATFVLKSAERKRLQGNLDPIVLFAPKEKIRAETERVLQSYGTGVRTYFQSRTRHHAENAGRKHQIFCQLRQGIEHQISRVKAVK